MVCKRWRLSFAAFLKDMGKRPEGMQLERKDNNGPYSPENCLWASLMIQANNKRTNHYLTYDREIHTIAEWSRLTGIAQQTLITRISRGWSVEETLTLPSIPGGHVARHTRDIGSIAGLSHGYGTTISQLGAMPEGSKNPFFDL